MQGSETVRGKSKGIDDRLSRILRTALWAVPALMASIGIVFVIIENQGHVNDPYWPWPTYLGIIVLGVIGPGLCWIFLRAVVRAADLYLVSQGQLGQRAEELATLNNIALASSRTVHFTERISAVLDHTVAALDADAGMVFIQEEGQPGLKLETHRGISLKMAQSESYLTPGHCLCGQAVERGEVLISGDVGYDTRCTSDICICEGFKSVACAPLEVKGQSVGLIQLASPNIGHFSEEQVSFLAAVAAQVGISIENARLYDQVQTFNLELEKKVTLRTRELEEAQWTLAEKARQLQGLLSESYRVQENTQERIAQDMHDGVTQLIIGALYETQAARDVLLSNPEGAEENLARAQDLLADMETEIRGVIYNLHPPVLDMMGVVVACKRLASTYSFTFETDCQVQVSGKQTRLTKDVEIAIYRIIQAALHNVVTHANAQHAKVDFLFRKDSLVLKIEDDGVGFEPDTILSTPGEHLGLIGMKERAEGIGAELAFNSTVGKGTSIILELSSPTYVG